MKLFAGVVAVIGKLKVIWKGWDIRTFIVASFVFQLILILIAPFRKRTSSRIVRISTWISYLLADWVAAQAVGLIAKVTQVSDDAESDVFGLWAQFLLLHLGGPDTITALALEDNELWLRTALHLGTQAYATLGILVRSVRQSTLWIATVLMFLAGVIKYLERVTSLHHGRLLDIDDDPYKKYMTKLLMEDEEDEEEKIPLSNAAMVRGSYWLFEAYKALYADLQLKHDVRRAARKFFLKRTSKEAYKMVEMQLNFMYEAMYTKMGIIQKTPWRILRHFVLSLQVVSFVIWCLWDKQGFRGYDVRVTYALLVGAIAVELLGSVRIQFSDWNIARRKKQESNKILLSTCDYVTCNASRACRNMWSRLQNIYLSRARWSMYLGRYNGFSSETWLEGVIGCLHLQDSQLSRREVRLDRKVSKKWDFIFEMLTKPSKQQSYHIPASNETLDMNQLLLRALPIHVLDYHTILQFWVYVTREYASHQWTDDIATCKDLADYLMYLMAFQPNMMFAAAGKSRIVSLQKEKLWKSDEWGFQFEDELREKKEEDEEKQVGEEDVDRRIRMKETFGILSLESNRERARVKEAKSQMREVRGCVFSEDKSEVLQRVWTELLCHAAISCRPNAHAARLKEGGEFLTFVWLLMVHLGIESRTPS